MSHEQQVNAARIVTLPSGLCGHSNCTPDQSYFNSSTSGYRNELIDGFGSLGPGINPINIMFSFLYRKLCGRFCITR